MRKMIQVVLSSEELEAFTRQAAYEGKTLSSWLGEAGRDRLEGAGGWEITAIEELDAFFGSLPERDSNEPEPEWAEDETTINDSRTRGLTDV